MEWRWVLVFYVVKLYGCKCFGFFCFNKLCFSFYVLYIISFVEFNMINFSCIIFVKWYVFVLCLNEIFYVFIYYIICIIYLFVNGYLGWFCFLFVVSIIVVDVGELVFLMWELEFIVKAEVVLFWVVLGVFILICIVLVYIFISSEEGFFLFIVLLVLLFVLFF